MLVLWLRFRVRVSAWVRFRVRVTFMVRVMFVVIVVV